MGIIGFLDCDAVLFDLDGVLVDSTAAVDLVWKAFASRHRLDRSFLGRLHGRRMVDIMAEVLPDHGGAKLDVETDWLETAEVAGAAGSLPIPGALELTVSLRGAPWAIVTSGTAAVARARLQAAGIAPPPVLVTAEEVSEGKPSPEPYLSAAAQLEVEPCRCVVIEDAPAGLAAARAAGAATIGVTTSHPVEQMVAADHLLPSVASIARVEGATERAIRLRLVNAVR